MKIGLLGLDSKLPNLAIMKLSNYWKGQGAEVFFDDDIPLDADKVFISVLFTKNRRKAEQIAEAFSGEVEIGGTGIDITKKLPEEIEACQPDYTLYTPEIVYSRNKGGVGSYESKLRKATDLANASQGFLYRGCVRSCDFCVVPEKEGRLHKVATLDQIIRPGSTMVTLLDNNLLAAPDILEILQQLVDWSPRQVINISQGIDVRLMTPEIAELLGQLKFWKQLRFAWDCPNQEKSVWRGIDLLSKFVKPRNQMVYMLTGYTSTFEQDMHRVQRIAEHGASPYVMPFNWNEKACVRMKHFARWVNGRIYKKCEFQDYEPWIRDRHLFELQPLF